MTDSKATAKPWSIGELSPKSRRSDQDNVWILSASGHSIALIERPKAELIVKAVNHHDELVEMLEGAKRFIENGIELGYIRLPDMRDDPANETTRKINAILAKVRS